MYIYADDVQLYLFVKWHQIDRLSTLSDVYLGSIPGSPVTFLS